MDFKAVSEMDEDILRVKRLQILKMLDQNRAWDILGTPEQTANMMEVVQKIAAGEVPSENVIALLKGKHTIF